MSRVRTHYDNLHVPRTADAAAIRRAFRSLSQKHHPDKNPENREKSEEIFKMINRAYEVLSDPAKRREHDEWISRQENPRAAASRSQATHGNRTATGSASRRYEYRRNPASGPSRAYASGHGSQFRSGARAQQRGDASRDAGLRSSGILKAMVLCRRVESSGGMIAFISMLSGVLAAATYAIFSLY